MGLMSLALAIIPLVRRSIPILSETERLKDELAVAHAELKRAQREIEDLRKDVTSWMELTAAWRARSERGLPPYYQARQNARAGQAQATEWYHCDCTPARGRFGFLRGEGAAE